MKSHAADIMVSNLFSLKEICLDVSSAFLKAIFRNLNSLRSKPVTFTTDTIKITKDFSMYFKDYKKSTPKP